MRVIEVSPIRLTRFVDAAPRVLASELRWVWLPAIGLAAALAWAERGRRRAAG